MTFCKICANIKAPYEIRTWKSIFSLLQWEKVPSFSEADEENFNIKLTFLLIHRKRSPFPAGEGLIMVLALFFGALFLVGRGRRPRRPVHSAQCYPRLPPRGGSRASGWRSLRNKRRCAYFEIAIIPLSRALPQACKPPALDVLLAKLDRCLQHDSRREPFLSVGVGA